jgi:hypothetical protein
LYSETEILGMLADSGFEDLQVFGGLDRRPRTPLDRLVVSARRPN